MWSKMYECTLEMNFSAGIELLELMHEKQVTDWVTLKTEKYL